MIGRSGERGSGISVLPARDDDDDDISTLYMFMIVARRYINTIYVYDLPRLRTSNVDRSDEKNGFTRNR